LFKPFTSTHPSIKRFQKTSYLKIIFHISYVAPAAGLRKIGCPVTAAPGRSANSAVFSKGTQRRQRLHASAFAFWVALRKKLCGVSVPSLAQPAFRCPNVFGLAFHVGPTQRQWMPAVSVL
jgi:hypothetical protein